MSNNTDYSQNSPNGVVALPFTPLLAPNAIFLTIFVPLFFTHVVLAVRYWRSYGYAIGMVCGLLLEMLGYVAKVQLAKDRGNKDAYIIYIIGLTLGPTFLSAALYLTVGALQRQYKLRCFGSVGPSLFATLFILGDFACLCFIGVGGSLAAIYASLPIGVDLMIAGLATQVVCTAIFCILLWFVYRSFYFVVTAGAIRWYIRGEKISLTEYENYRSADPILVPVLGAALAAACLFIRSCWRVAELSGGFNGPLASKEGVFIALDSIPMITMSVLLSALHPAIWFLK